MKDETPADPFGELADEFVELYRQGQQPSVEDYAERFPEYAERIRELFPVLAMMEQAGDGMTSGSADDFRQPLQPELERVGDFQLLQEIGRGGMGVVYEAEQLSLRRRVAVKLLSTHIAEDEQLMSRFQREAQAAAKLHHSNIVPVYEVGREGNISFYAMQLIRGQGLDDVIRELKHFDLPADVRPEKVFSEDQNSNGRSESQRAESEKPFARQASQRIARSLFSWRYSQPGKQDSGSPSDFAETVIQESESEPPIPPSQSVADQDSTREGSTEKMGDPLMSRSSVVLPGQTDTNFTESGTVQYFRSVARIGIQVADALTHAHREGIIHRDIKPSNLLLDMHGNVWITDFGLAKTEEGNLTRTGDVLGTLQYMPPERFHGWSDPRSDLYSLGITLYEMLALQPAFDAPDRMKVMHQILEESPQPLRKYNSQIPTDLEAIVFKAIHREPQRRYQSGEELKEDLERFLKGEPIVARRVTRREQFWLWCRRNPIIAGLLFALLIVMLGGLAGVTTQWRRAEANAFTARQNAAKAELAAQQAQRQARKASAAARREQQARIAAESARRRIHRLLYVAQMNLLPQAWQEANVARVHELLKTYVPKAEDADLRGFEWYYWWKKSHQFDTSFDHGAPVFDTATTRDGLRLVSAGGGSSPLKLWDVKNGQLIRNLEQAEGWIRAVAFSSDGRWLAAGESDGDIRYWDLKNGKRGVLPGAFESAVRDLDFSPDGKTLAVGSANGSLRFWDLSERKLVDAWTDHPAGISALAWSPAGDSLAMAFGYWGTNRDVRQIWIRDVHGKATRKLPEGTGPLTLNLAYSHDGKTLAAAGTDDVKLWHLPEGRFQQLRQHSDVVTAVAFSPDDRWLVSGGSDRLIQFWDRGNESHVATLKGHGNTVSSLAFDRNGTRLISGSEDGTVKLWTNPSSPGSENVFEHDHPIRSIAVSPGGKRMAAAGDAGTIYLRSVTTGERVGTLDSELRTITHVLFRPEGDKLIACGSREESVADGRGLIEVWSLKTDRCLQRFANPDNGYWDVDVSPDGKLIAAGGTKSRVEVWSSTTGELAQTFTGHTAAIRAVAFSENGNRLASAGTDCAVRVWDLTTGERVGFYAGHTRTVLDLEFSPDDRTLVSVSEDQTARVWDVPQGTLQAVLKGHAKRVSAVAVSPDGKTIATGSGDRTIRLWDPVSGRQKGRLEGHRLRVDGLAFSPDGRTLVSGDISGIIRLWQGRSGIPDSRE